jgi:predicted nucleotidyltransferase
MVAVDAQIRRRALAAAEALARFAPLRAAYLFGSHVEGRADRWSDIDLAVFLDGVETWEPQRETRLIIRVQKEVGFDVEPHVFSAELLEHPEPGSLARDVVLRGLRIL